MPSFDAARGIANAILYEGFLLYPYTASAQKNQMRWQFGVVVPPAYAANGTGEHSDQHTEVLFEATGRTRIDGLVRFLQLQRRSVEALVEGAFEPVPSLEIDGTQHLSFDGALEREVHFVLDLLTGSAVSETIRFEPGESIEELRDARGVLVGRIVLAQWPLDGALSVSAEPAASPAQLRVLRITLENRSELADGSHRNVALRTSFISAHTLLAIEGGAFLSPVDPPDSAQAATAALANRRTWPVLMGEVTDPQRSSLALSSPIILGDFPEVAEKTDTDHFDATEIDELLTLSVLSLSDAERAEACATDPRARKIVERAEAYGAAEVLAVHEGALTAEFPEAWRDLAMPSEGSIAGAPFATLFPDPRNRRLIEPTAPSKDDLAQLSAGEIEAFEQLPPATLEIAGVTIAKGSKVRLAPKRRADAWDLFLRDKLATVRTIHQDFEDKIYVAVTVDEDPATEMHEWYGRSFFFDPDEIEPVAVTA